MAVAGTVAVAAVTGTRVTRFAVTATVVTVAVLSATKIAATVRRVAAAVIASTVGIISAVSVSIRVAISVGIPEPEEGEAEATDKNGATGSTMVVVMPIAAPPVVAGKCPGSGPGERVRRGGVGGESSVSMHLGVDVRG